MLSVAGGILLALLIGACLPAIIWGLRIGVAVALAVATLIGIYELGAGALLIGAAIVGVCGIIWLVNRLPENDESRAVVEAQMRKRGFLITSRGLGGQGGSQAG